MDYVLAPLIGVEYKVKTSEDSDLLAGFIVGVVCAYMAMHSTMYLLVYACVDA
jgi:inner membrane protein involved in colicin E2 resistance